MALPEDLGATSVGHLAHHEEVHQKVNELYGHTHDSAYVNLSGDSEVTGNITVSGTISGGQLVSGGQNVSVSGHVHVSTDITNFAEAVSDQVGTMVAGSQGLLSIAYNDTDNTLSFTVDNDLSQYNNSTSDFQSAAQVNTAITSTVNKGFVDALNIDADTLDGNDASAFAVSGHTHVSANITDFAEGVSDQVGLMVSGNTETGISVTYQDVDNTLDFAVAYGTPVSQTPDQVNAAGTGATAARASHVHNIPTDTAVGIDDNSVSAEGSAASFARSDHTHAITGFALTEHNHDERYYTETEVDGLLSDKVNTSSVGNVNGVASLDSGGKVPSAQLPAIAFTETHLVQDLPTRDGLAVQEGDVAIVQDAGNGNANSYIYDGTTWQELSTPIDGVTAVNAISPLASTGGVAPEISISDTIPVNLGGTGASTASAARTNLGLTIGTNVQAYSSVLQNTTASFTTTLKTKLDGIEAGATGDQTASEIESIVNHNNLLGFVANEHIDWTTDQGTVHIHSNNITQASVIQHQGALSIAESQITDLDHYTTADANAAIDGRVNKAFIDALNVDADTLDGIDASGFSASGHTHVASNVTDFAEAVSDQIGTMVTGNTETLITVTYQDTDNTLDFAINSDLSQYNNATSDFQSGAQVSSTISSTVTKSFVDGLSIDADTVDGSHASDFASTGHGHVISPRFGMTDPPSIYPDGLYAMDTESDDPFNWLYDAGIVWGIKPYNGNHRHLQFAARHDGAEISTRMKDGSTDTWKAWRKLATDGMTGTFDFGGSLTVGGTAVSLSGHTHATADITTGTFADARISASSVQQHVTKLYIDGLNVNADTVDGQHASAFATSGQGALADTAAQPGDAVSTFTNDAGYITGYSVTQGDVTQHQGALAITESQISDLDHYTNTDANAAIDARVTKIFVDALGVNATTLDGQDSTAFSESGHTHDYAPIGDYVESTTVDHIVKLTQSQYDALATKDSRTLYVIEG